MSMNTTDMIDIATPLEAEACRSLRAGQQLRVSGTILTGRDAAHQRLWNLLNEGKSLPIPLQDEIIYYVGPTPARPGEAIGSAGPTTSSRMDAFAPLLFEHGLRASIGKGYRGEAVREALARYGAVHLAALGGAGALLSKCIVKAEIVAYEDLGTEAIRRLTIKDFPVMVAYDCHGNSVYPETGTHQ